MENGELYEKFVPRNHCKTIVQSINGDVTEIKKDIKAIREKMFIQMILLIIVALLAGVNVLNIAKTLLAGG